MATYDSSLHQQLSDSLGNHHTGTSEVCKVLPLGIGTCQHCYNHKLERETSNSTAFRPEPGKQNDLGLTFHFSICNIITSSYAQKRLLEVTNATLGRQQNSSVCSMNKKSHVL